MVAMPVRPTLGLHVIAQQDNLRGAEQGRKLYRLIAAIAASEDPIRRETFASLRGDETDPVEVVSLGTKSPAFARKSRPAPRRNLSLVSFPPETIRRIENISAGLQQIAGVDHNDSTTRTIPRIRSAPLSNRATVRFGETWTARNADYFGAGPSRLFLSHD